MFRRVVIRCTVLVVLLSALSASAAVRLGVKAELEKDKEKLTETQYYVLDLQLAATGKVEESVDVEWYFITRPLDTKGKKQPPQLIYGGSKSFKIPAGKRVNHKVESNKLNSGKKKQKKKTVYFGSIYETYLVFVKQGDEVVQQKAGYAKYLKPEWTGQLQRVRGGR